MSISRLCIDWIFRASHNSSFYLCFLLPPSFRLPAPLLLHPSISFSPKSTLKTNRVCIVLCVGRDGVVGGTGMVEALRHVWHLDCSRTTCCLREMRVGFRGAA